MDPNALTADQIARALQVPAGTVLALRNSALSPALLDFVGLVREQHAPVPEAVVLHDGQPFVYVLEAPASAVADDWVKKALGLLALRDDAPYVAVVRPGSVQVFALTAVDREHRPVLEASALEPGLLARLVSGDLAMTANTRASSTGAHELMLTLLNAVTDHLISIRGCESREALALVGRALFVRFLADRGLVPMTQPFPGVTSVEACFSTPAQASATCRWLDLTFNGDLLELPDSGSQRYFGRLAKQPGGGVLSDLTAIVRGDRPVGDGAYQTRFSWGDLHFSYVPVGLLSQVYEEYAHRFETGDAKRQSVYYTPRHIAEYMVDRSLRMLGPAAHTARILDPASGGGVFLLSLLRRLVRARWEATGEQPTTPVIRSILNQQIVGFDINPAARQLSALALYLTAIELDPDAATLTNLIFEPLQGRVLMAADEWQAPDTSVVMGSLSPSALERFAGQFDLAIGNPPWTSVADAKRRAALSAVTASLMQARGCEPLANPDGVPDLPFLWAATRWVKPGGVLSFALHGRLLTKVSPAGHAARTQLFRGLDVKFVLNGMELRNTAVWPGMKQHFCLLFAHNQPAPAGSAFYAVTPVEDQSLNREGRIRIDHKDAWVSDVAMVESTPYLFKTLAKGNALDVELLERITQLGYPCLEALVQAQPMDASDGYQVKQGSDAGVPAEFLTGKPVMPLPAEATWIQVPTAELPRFELERVHRRRDAGIYRAPIVLLREAPSTDSRCPLAMLAWQDVVYRESYIGYSCHRAPDPETLALMLTCIFNSDLFLYFGLLTSSRLGCERSILLKAEMERFPVPSPETLTAAQRKALKALGRTWAAGGVDHQAVAAWVRELYRLRPADDALIRDRLACGLPFATVRKRAISPPSEAEAQLYARRLQETLVAFDLSPSPLQVTVLGRSQMSPWRFLYVGGAGATSKIDPRALVASLAIGDLLDASVVQLEQEEGLVVGVLHQRRYWTETAARTLALDLIRRSHPVLARGVA